MRTSRERIREPSAEAALLEKIEELSFLRALNDRLACVPDFASASRALVDVVWEERQVDAVAYLSVDSQRRVCRLEAAAPVAAGEQLHPEFAFDTPPFDLLLCESAPTLLPFDTGPPWQSGAPVRAAGLRPAVLISAPTRVRGATTGLLLVHTAGEPAAIEEHVRLLAIIATSAALALDVARNQGREEFLATLRHDINNPVSAALGYTEMLADQLKAAGRTDLVALTVPLGESLKAVADLVSNYLSMEAIDRGAPWLSFAEIDVMAMVAEVVERYRPFALEKQVAVAWHGTCPTLRADRHQLGRVVTNLISNAIKYTPGPGHVEVTVGGDRAQVTIEVRDSGFGFPREAMPQLFTKYGRFHRNKGIPGTGLGLYISRGIVEAHGGSIEVESEPGLGARVLVSIPQRPA